MASCFGKSTRILLVLLSLLLAGCDRTPVLTVNPVKRGEAVGQTYCGIDHYEEKSDSCKSFMLSQKEEISPATVAALVPIVKRDLVVIDTVVVSEGQGCLEITKKTKLPLSIKACRNLLLANNRHQQIFIARNREVKYYDPIIKKDEVWYLVENKKENTTYWVIPKGE